MTKENKSSKDIAAEIIGGAATALTYTDCEILETLPLEQAKEFIRLRNKIIADVEKEKKQYSIGNCDKDISLAAEDNIQYE